MSNTELATTEKSTFMPVMNIDDVLSRHKQLMAFKDQVLKVDVDFGVIPGTNTKPVLLKPGAEKLCTLFGLSARFEIIERIEDWSGETHKGEPFFYYLYRCSLSRGDQLIAESDGSCNSHEKKYRYRKAERVCPSCGASTIIKGKAEYGGGWLCWKKNGGCNAKFNDGDQAIESQVVGNIPNPDVADLVNTMQKMAQKRALVAASLLAVNASEFFTQDMEDFQHGHDEPAQPEPQQPEPVKTIELATPADIRSYEAVRHTAIEFGYRTASGSEPKPLVENATKADAIRRTHALQKWIEENTVDPSDPFAMEDEPVAAAA